MTAFDPALVREILQARQDRINGEAFEELRKKFSYAISAHKNVWDEDDITRTHDKAAYALWNHADSIKPILAYLDDRIWNEKTRVEKIAATMEDWEFDANFQGTWVEGLVRDVLLAAEIVDGKEF